MPHCTRYHNDAARSGLFQVSTRGVDHVGTWQKYLNVPLGTAVRGAPLLLEHWVARSGPRRGQEHDVVFVATSDNRVNAYLVQDLRAQRTHPLWTVTLGPPLQRGGSNIPPPLGVCSTPVIDEAAGQMHVLSLQDAGGGRGVYHVMVLDVDTGKILRTAPLTDPGAAGRPKFDGNVQDQRGGLNLVDGWVYATFADFLAFDAGPYHGWVAGWNANTPTNQRFMPTTSTVFGGGAWGPGGVAAAADGSLFVATGNGLTNDNYWRDLDGGGRLGNKFTSGETSPRFPSLCAHAGHVYIAWKGDGNDNLNVGEMQTSGHRVTGLHKRPILGDTSPKSPAIASFNTRLFIAWKGDGNNNLNVMYSDDNGTSFGHKHISGETSREAPSLCIHKGNLYIAWKGDGNDNLNVAQVMMSGANITSLAKRPVLGDTSPRSPSIASDGGRLFIAWKGDGNDNLNVMVSDDDGHTFKNKFVSPETSPEGPSLCTHDGNLFISWKGDGNNNLNAAQVLMSEGQIVGFDKAILADTSPLTPALASLNGQLYVGWKGDGNDNLNVMSLASPGEIADFPESVMRLSSKERLGVLDWYTPLDAQVLDQQDLDIGGSSPMVLPTIGGLDMLLVTGKDGSVYLLNQRHMGHWGGAVCRRHVFSSESKCAPAFFRTERGEDIAFVVGGGQPGLVAYNVVANGAGPGLHERWRATGSGVNLGDAPGSPAVQSFPDQDAVVWIVDDTIGALRAFNVRTGQAVYSSAHRGSDALGPIAHFPPITCATASVFVGTANGFACYGAPNPPAGDLQA
jgi:hypothetical protein